MNFAESVFMKQSNLVHMGESLKMNPYPILSKAAQNLRYPPGIDTIAYWGNGRFSIGVTTFWDCEASGARSIIRDIKRFRYESPLVFCLSSNSKAVVDLSVGVYRIYKEDDLIPKNEQDYFNRLAKDGEEGNINTVIIVPQYSKPSSPSSAGK